MSKSAISKKTEEPLERMKAASKDDLIFVVQEHHASHIHYDFRLELDGVLKSWAVPKGPSLNPADKRLAIQVEDHPFDYRSFEGIIPAGNYGAGEVIVWDEGTYKSSPEVDRQTSEITMRKGLEKGHVTFILKGHKLQGEFSLVRLRGERSKQWLLIKKKDAFASQEDVTQNSRSVVSNRSLRANTSLIAKSSKKPKNSG